MLILLGIIAGGIFMLSTRSICQQILKEEASQLPSLPLNPWESLAPALEKNLELKAEDNLKNLPI